MTESPTALPDAPAPQPPETGAESEAAVEAPAPVAPAAGAPTGDVVSKLRSVKGIHVLAVLLVICTAFLVLDVVSARRNQRIDRQRRQDALVVRDTARVTETWTKLPDGMTLVLRPTKPGDDETLRIIRRTMKWQRINELRGDYSDAAFPNNQDIPGRANLEWGSSNGYLNVRYRDVDGGGELHWITTDSVMLDALDEWGTAVSTGGYPAPKPAPATVLTTTTAPTTVAPTAPTAPTTPTTAAS